MASPDLDFAELHLTVLDYFTRKPYVDASGLTTRDLPYESIDVVDQMYEPTAQDISTATITLPSLLAFPELRPLLQNIKEGNRIELYNFQPDCGSPVFAGFIPPNGISESDGKVSIDAIDTLGQLRWQHIRRYEYYNLNAAGLYARSLSGWQDLLAEDFAGGNPAGDYTVTNTAGAVPQFQATGLMLIGSGSANCSSLVVALRNGVTPAPGDHYSIEAFVTLNPTLVGSSPQSICELSAGLTDTTQHNFIYGSLQYDDTGFPAADNKTSNIWVGQNGGGGVRQLALGTTNATLVGPFTHHLVLDAVFNSDGTVSLSLYIDNVNVGAARPTWAPTSPPVLFPFLSLTAQQTGDVTTVTKWRVRKLAPVLNQAPRFNPQTPDAIGYQPNSEEGLQLLQFVAQKDAAEYRPVYKAWPQTDELELDAAGTLGAFPSRGLGYDQPGASPAIDASSQAPFAVDADPAYGAFVVAPPFRFEEGWNLVSAPKIGPRENPHANDILQYGANALDSQLFSEDFAPAETGRPQHAPSGAQYPYFEQIINDDRAGLPSLLRTLATNNLRVRTDSTPSLQLQVVDEVWSAFRWRAGDSPYVITRSLRNNLEQEMRVVKVQYRAGSPGRDVVLGKVDRDPDQLRRLHEAAMMEWLYDQSGTSPTVYIIPLTGAIAAFSNTSIVNLPLDQFTTGFAIIYAAFHWLTDAHVAKVLPVVNGATMIAPTTTPSDTDSGLIIVTSAFQAPGIYQISFTNQDSVSRTLNGAFLVLRIKS